MSIVRIIAFTIFLSLILLGKAQTDIADELTVEKYLGTWYEIGRFVPHELKTHKIICEWFNAEKYPHCVNCVKEVYEDLPGGIASLKIRGYGSIDKWNYMSMSYPDLRTPTNFYAVMASPNEKELILRNQNNIKNSKFLSRTHIVSALMKLQFEALAIENKLYAVYADPEDCAPLS